MSWGKRKICIIKEKTKARKKRKGKKKLNVGEEEDRTDWKLIKYEVGISVVNGGENIIGLKRYGDFGYQWFNVHMKHFLLCVKKILI